MKYLKESTEAFLLIILLGVFFQVASRLDVFPSSERLKDQCLFHAEWLWKDYPERWRYDRLFRKTAIYRYLKDHATVSDKIIYNQTSAFHFRFDQIILTHYSLPFYSLFNTNAANYYRNLDRLGIRYLYLTGESTGQALSNQFIGPYRPLLMTEKEAVAHLELVAQDRIPAYVESIDFAERNRDDFIPHFQAHLFKIHIQPIEQSAEKKEKIIEILRPLEMKNIHSNAVVEKIRQLEWEVETLSRIKKYDEKLEATHPLLNFQVK